MLLETALRPITHFPVPAKELSDRGSCSHGSDLKLWPQRNATCPTSHDTELSASFQGVRQLCFGCQSCCLHWAKKSYGLSGSSGLSHSIFPVLKRSNPTELPRENFSPTIHPCWLLIAWKSRWVSNRGTILTVAPAPALWNKIPRRPKWEGEWPISRARLKGKGSRVSLRLLTLTQLTFCCFHESLLQPPNPPSSHSMCGRCSFLIVVSKPTHMTITPVLPGLLSVVYEARYTCVPAHLSSLPTPSWYPIHPKFLTFPVLSWHYFFLK